MDVTIHQMMVVLAVADRQNFTRAAKALHVSQSSLSRTVAQVEHASGTALFERTTRRVRLTPMGEEFVRIARSVVDTHEQGFRRFQEFLEGSRGHLRVAVLPSLAATLIPQVVARFRRSFPHVFVEVEDALAQEIVESVVSGRVDLGMTAATTVQASNSETIHGLPFRVFASDEFQCIVPLDHPFTRQEFVEWDELAGESFVAFDESSSVRSLVDSVFLARGTAPSRQVIARNVASVAGLCAAGLGVSAAPGFVLPLMEFADVAFVPLRNPTAERHVGVLLDPRRQATPATEGFLGILAALSKEGGTLPRAAAWSSEESR